ncbi:MAG: DUF2304 domain-containing protein [Deltaproteobacteria bacterium]|nr:DUF2304 domain-containing protein [Deltaproteobacteria bacterium]
MDYFQIFSIIGSVVLLALIINFIRLGILKERYSVLWIACSVAILILSVKKGILDYLAVSLGVAYPPSLLFLVAFMFVLLISLHFSVVISIFHEKNKILSQEVTLLKEALREAGINVGGKGKDGK